MKICILIEQLQGGGAERSAGLLSTILTGLDHDVFVITLFDNNVYPFSGKLINLGLYKNGSRTVLNKYLRYKELKKKIDRYQFDLILDFRMKNYPLREFILNKFVFRSKMINMVRSYNLNWYFPKPRLLSKYLYKNYSGINGVSLEIKKEIETKYGFSNVNVIHNPIDQDFITQKASEELAVKEEFIIVLGRLHPVKQIKELIEAYNNSILPDRNINLLIIGDGPDRNVILNKIDELNLHDKVEILPFQENPFKFLFKARFLVLSSLIEGFPRVLIEALACGTPVISFDCNSGPRDIIQNRKNGLLVEDQNFDKLTESLNEFVLNESLYNTCKANTKNSVLKFSLSAIGDLWRTYLNTLTQD